MVRRRGRWEVPGTGDWKTGESMYIHSLKLKNIRSFKSLRVIDFVHPDRQYCSREEGANGEPAGLVCPRLNNVTLLLGENGSGKTTVLRGLALAAFGPAALDLVRDSSVVRLGETEGEVAATLQLHEQDGTGAGALHNWSVRLVRRGERLRVNLPEWEETGGSRAPRESRTSASRKVVPKGLSWSGIYESRNDAFFVVGYGATRRVERLDRYDSGARTQARATRDLRVWSLFEDSFSLIPLASWLPELQQSNPGRFTQVVSLIRKLIAPGAYNFTGRQNDQGDYLFERGGLEIPFQGLSDGYRAFVGWVADLLFHICYGCPKGKKLVESRGLVLVDEIDLHLHPRWQMQVIETVAQTLPRMQFVFTSHSPLVAGSLEWMNIITLKTSAKTNQTTARRLRQGIHGLDADQILLSEFFGLKSTMAPARRKQLESLTARIRTGDPEAPLQLIRQLSQGMEAG